VQGRAWWLRKSEAIAARAARRREVSRCAKEADLVDEA